MAGADEINSTLKGIVTNIGQEVSAVQSVATAILTTGAQQTLAIQSVASAILSVFPRLSGTFTLSNATVTVVSQPGILASGFPLWIATNATAALTQRTAGLFLSAVTAGSGFAMSTQSGSAIGTETFSYIVFNPS